jgi:hypothetical protein
MSKARKAENEDRDFLDVSRGAARIIYPPGLRKSVRTAVSDQWIRRRVNEQMTKLFPDHFHEDPIGQFAFEEVDYAILDVAFQDLARGFWRLRVGELRSLVSRVV